MQWSFQKNALLILTNFFTVLENLEEQIEQILSNSPISLHIYPSWVNSIWHAEFQLPGRPGSWVSMMKGTKQQQFLGFNSYLSAQFPPYGIVDSVLPSGGL